MNDIMCVIRHIHGISLVIKAENRNEKIATCIPQPGKGLCDVSLDESFTNRFKIDCCCLHKMIFRTLNCTFKLFIASPNHYFNGQVLIIAP